MFVIKDMQTAIEARTSKRTERLVRIKRESVRRRSERTDAATVTGVRATREPLSRLVCNFTCGTYGVEQILY